LDGGPDFQSEDLLAYEIGYRGQPLPNLSLSISTYFNVYDNLRTIEASGPLVFPLLIENGMRGHTYGIEAWATYALTDWWHLNAGANGLREELSLVPGSRDVFGVQYAGNDPSYQFQLRSDMDLPHDVDLELGLRGVDSLASPAVAGYVEANARLSWAIRDGLELSLVGLNLLHARHEEFASSGLPPLEIPRSGYLSARWEF
jgi:iron complex outermembrane receptor protein